MHKWSFRTSNPQAHLNQILKKFTRKKGNGLFFNLKQVALNSDENWPSNKSNFKVYIIMNLHKNKKNKNNNQGVFLELLVELK